MIAADLIEDARWIADSGENIERAAIRLGFAHPVYLERRLTELDQRDTVLRFYRNGPRPTQRPGMRIRDHRAESARRRERREARQDA